MFNPDWSHKDAAVSERNILSVTTNKIKGVDVVQTHDEAQFEITHLLLILAKLLVISNL